MKTTINYVDEAKLKLGIESDYAMAKYLELHRATVSLWRNGKGSMDDYAASKIAEVLEVDPMIVIAAANAEREKDEGKKDYWQKYWSRLGGMAAAIMMTFVTFFVTPGAITPAQAAPVLNTHSAFDLSIHYAKLRRYLGRVQRQLKLRLIILKNSLSPSVISIRHHPA